MTQETYAVLITVGSQQEGKKIADALVGERLAACVNILPGVRSIYVWDGEVCDDPELLLVAKTTKEMIGTLVERVRQLHSYDLPETIALPIADGSKPYIDWIVSGVGPIRPA